MSDKIKVETELTRHPALKQIILRLPEVMRVTGYKRAAIYNMMKEGTFPKSRKIGPRAVGWNSVEIEKWIEARLVKVK